MSLTCKWKRVLLIFHLSRCLQTSLQLVARRILYLNISQYIKCNLGSNQTVSIELMHPPGTQLLLKQKNFQASLVKIGENHLVLLVLQRRKWVSVEVRCEAGDRIKGSLPLEWASCPMLYNHTAFWDCCLQFTMKTAALWFQRTVEV